MGKKKLRSRKPDHQSQQNQTRRRFSTIFVVGLIVIALGAVIIWSSGDRTASAKLDYTSDQVVHDKPLHAVHEMEPSNLASIPFLAKGEPQPKINLPKTYYNFGSIGANKVVNYDFVIANTGNAPLTISRAYTTCGCTTADFTATVIPPGKVSIMTLTFDAGIHDTRGKTVRRGVFIENNDPQNPQMEIWIQASVRNKD